MNERTAFHGEGERSARGIQTHASLILSVNERYIQFEHFPDSTKGEFQTTS
jgi:hypothetical protein